MTVVLATDCAGCARIVVSAMANEPQSTSERKKNEAPNDPKLRERVQRLSEKVSSLDETLDQIEQTTGELRGESS